MKTYTKQVLETKPRLEIMYDRYSESPRKWDNLGYFITVDKNYYSPDRNSTLESIVKETEDTATSQKEHIKLIKKEVQDQTREKVIAIYPVTKYEHCGTAYFLGTKQGFDYSNNGFYIVTDKTAKVLGTPKKRFEKVIRGEIEIYNKYLRGEVYGFALYDDKGEVEDSCWGFYDVEDIRGVLPEDWKDENLSEYFID